MRQFIPPHSARTCRLFIGKRDSCRSPALLIKQVVLARGKFQLPPPLPPSPIVLPNSSEATVIQSLEPLVGAGLASSTLGEPFPSPLGASLVIGGCLCSSLADSSTLGDNAGQQEKP